MRISHGATPLVILGIVLGLSHGPKGVALGYSSALTLLLVPIAAWSKLGTGITWMDLWGATKPPFLSGLLVKLTLGGRLPLILFLFVGVAFVLGTHAWILLIAMNQKPVYIGLLSHLFPRLQPDQKKSNNPEVTARVANQRFGGVS